MCYTIVVMEKYCRRKHVQGAKLCWRQCRLQAALSHRTKNWRKLCDNRKRTDNELEAWYPFTPHASDPVCDVCQCLETDHEARELRTVLDPVDTYVQECERAMSEHIEARTRIEDALIPGPPMDDSEKLQLIEEYVVLQRTQEFVQRNSDEKLKQVKVCQDRYDEIERRYESIYCDPILDRAVALFDSRFLIYMGRPDDVEKERLDCPQHLLRCDSKACEILVC